MSSTLGDQLESSAEEEESDDEFLSSHKFSQKTNPETSAVSMISRDSSDVAGGEEFH